MRACGADRRSVGLVGCGALELGRRYGVSSLEESLPISVIGTGPDLNSATDNGLARAAELLRLSVPEIKNHRARA